MNIQIAEKQFLSNNKSHNAYIAFDDSNTDKRPVIYVFPEWWGLNDYSKRRARDLAQLGYLAVALDIYGDNAQADNPKDASALAGPIYSDPERGARLIKDSQELVHQFIEADLNKTAAIGYCMGGFVALNAAIYDSSLLAVVSFHGGLNIKVTENTTVHAKILVCHGADDAFENDSVAGFKKEMNDVDADYIFKEYAGAKHAFTNPKATSNGEKFNLPLAYNEAADIQSWQDMKAFFRKIFE